MAKIVNITDVCTEIFAGGDAPKSNMSFEPTPEFDVPIYSNGEAKKGLYGYTNYARVTQPSITISARGTIGYAAIRNEPFTPIVRLITLIPKTESINIRYLYYAVQNYNFSGSGTSIPQLTVPMLKSYTFPLPDMETQLSIVGILDKINNLIDLRKKQLDKLDELVKARFVELFGDPIANSKKWNQICITEICHSIYGGGTPSKSHPEYYEGNIPWVTPKDMKSLRIIDSSDHITLEAIANSTTRLIPEKSVLMVIRSGILKHTLPVAINLTEVTINQDMKAFVPNDLVTVEYLMYHFMTIEADVLSGVRGVTADNIDFKMFQKRLIAVPPMKMQKDFSRFVEQVEKTKLTIHQGLSKMEVTKGALMQKYFE